MPTESERAVLVAFLGEGMIKIQCPIVNGTRRVTMSRVMTRQTAPERTYHPDPPSDPEIPDSRSPDSRFGKETEREFPIPDSAGNGNREFPRFPIRPGNGCGPDDQ